MMIHNDNFQDIAARYMWLLLYHTASIISLFVTYLGSLHNYQLTQLLAYTTIEIIKLYSITSTMLRGF